MGILEGQVGTHTADRLSLICLPDFSGEMLRRRLEKWIDLRGEVWVRDVGMEFKAMKLKEITRGVREQESKDKPCSLLTF